jgi:hypothetical protein
MSQSKAKGASIPFQFKRNISVDEEEVKADAGEMK